jgi:uncharacterized BrkB/YihY/UPF0761 family membrane protein
MAGPLHKLRRRLARTGSNDAASDSTPRAGSAHRTDHQGRIASGRAEVQARLEQTRQNLEARRPDNAGVDAAFRWLQLQIEAGVGLLAGAIAFRFFLFLLPAVFVVVIGLGIGADTLHGDPRDVARSFGMAGLAASAVQSGAASSTTTRWVTFAFATVALISGARNLIRALGVTHALIWQVPPRKVRHLTAISLGVTLAFLGGTIVVGLLGRAENSSVLLRLVGLVLLIAVASAIWVAASLRLFPRPDGVTWRDVVPGSVLFGVGVEGLHTATVIWFAPYLQSKSETYGAIGAALAILFWAYLLGRLITAAAALNAVLWRPRDG